MDEKWQTKRARKVTEHRQHVRHHFIGSAAKLYTLEKKQGDLRELPFANRVPRPFVFIHKNLFCLRGNETGHWHAAGHVSSLRRLPVLVERTVRMNHNQKMDEWRMRNSAVQLIR